MSKISPHEHKASQGWNSKLDAFDTPGTDPASEDYVDAALAAHVAAPDPHTVYQKESEKGQPNGYAPLDAGGLILSSDLPATLQHIADTWTVDAAGETITLPDDPVIVGSNPAWAARIHNSSAVAGADALAVSIQSTSGTGHYLGFYPGATASSQGTFRGGIRPISTTTVRLYSVEGLELQGSTSGGGTAGWTITQDLVATASAGAATITASGQIRLNSTAGALRFDSSTGWNIQGTTYTQAQIDDLFTVAGLAVTDGNIIVGNGTTWVAESGATARTSLGLGNVTDDAQLKRSANDFNSFTLKGTPVAADILLIEDSAASGVKKYVTIGTLPFPDFSGTFTDNRIIRADSTGGVQDSLWTVADTTGDLSIGVAAVSISNSSGDISVLASGDMALDCGDVLTLDAGTEIQIDAPLVLGTDLAISHGGTGSSTAAAALTALGVLRAVQASNFAITGMSLQSTDLVVTLAAGKHYMILTVAEYQVNAVDSFKYNYAVTSTVLLGFLNTSQTNVTRLVHAATQNLTTDNSVQQIMHMGLASGGASGGTLTFQVGKQADGGADGTLYEGGAMVAIQLD